MKTIRSLVAATMAVLVLCLASAAFAESFTVKAVDYCTGCDLGNLGLALTADGANVTVQATGLLFDAQDNVWRGVGSFEVRDDSGVNRLRFDNAATIVLGLVFSGIQAYEYIHAPFAFKLANGGNIYGSTFFMATGFHGFHVIVGTIFLIVCYLRAVKGDFTPKQHFGFEAAAWYWHFVDVVWLFLFVSIYVWGGWGAPIHG